MNQQEGRGPIKDMIEESGLDAAEYADVAQALAFLREVVPEDAPTPSAALAELLSGGVVTAIALRRSRRRRIAVASGAVAATVLLGTGVAAATNTLPEPAQRFLSEVSDKYLPFEIPSPDERDGGVPGTPGDTPTPVSQVVPGKNKSEKPDKGDKADQSGDADDGGSGAETDNPGKPNGPKDKTDKVQGTNNGNGNGNGTNNGNGNGNGNGTNNGNGNGNGNGNPNPGTKMEKPVKPTKPETPAKPEQAKPTQAPTEPPGQGNGNGNGKGGG